MGGLSLWHWLVVGVIVLLLFGRGRFSAMMSDLAHGLKSFKKEVSSLDTPLVPDQKPEGKDTLPLENENIEKSKSNPQAPNKSDA